MLIRPAYSSLSSGSGCFGRTTCSRNDLPAASAASSSANSAPFALISIMCTYCSSGPSPQYGELPMHHTSHTSSAPRRSASVTLASLTHTASVHTRPPRLSGAMTSGSDIPAASSWSSTSVCGTATHVFVTKSTTLNEPSTVEARIASQSIPRCGKTLCTTPSASPRAGSAQGPRR